MSFKVLEGVPRKGGFTDEWDFGFNTWTEPFYLEVTAEHPDGPSGFVHEYWKGAAEIWCRFFSSREEAEAEGRKWTPERRRQYLAHPSARWGRIQDGCLIRGIMTPKGRRRYRNARDGYPFAEMALGAGDFRNGITPDMLEWLGRYRFLLHYGEGQELELLEQRLEGVPEPLLSHYRGYRKLREEEIASGWD